VRIFQMPKRTFNPKPKFGLSSHEVVYALRKLFKPLEWLVVEELYIPGFNRRVDIWAMMVSMEPIIKRKSRVGFEYLSMHAIEVKVDPSDFKKELGDPAKRQPAILFSNYYSFAAPRGVIDPDEIPAGLGYIQIEGNKAKIIIEPEYTRAEPCGWDFIASLGRAVLRAT
jgi:hypothetical protein